MGNFKHIDPKAIAISDFNYPLPDERIAKYPLPQRDQSKLLVWQNQSINDHIFTELPNLLPAHSLLLFNNTKVIRARLFFEKDTGARIEIFCLDPHDPADYQIAFQQTQCCTWKCMIGNLKKWKTGRLQKTITAEGKTFTLTAEKIPSANHDHLVHFSWDNPYFEFARIIEIAGILPIPPYLHRETEASDLQRYQTVYSKIKGSVAAPTAGLHFTENVLKEVQAKGHQIQELTLHVGAGTFQPVKSDTIDGHQMHSEQIHISRPLLDKLLHHKGPKIAVGTTTIRTLESIYWLGIQAMNEQLHDVSLLKINQWEPYDNEMDIPAEQSLQALVAFMEKQQTDHLVAATQIIIAPGYSFRMIDGMLTNFHQPQSTLLLLISAFLGDQWKTIYQHALDNGYRFLSYGDSNLYLK